MRQELIGSTLAHALLALLLVVATTGTLPPPIPPGDIMMVTPVDALPARLAPAPAAAVPKPAEDEASDRLTAAPAPEPEAIPVRPPTRPRERPKAPQPKEPARPKVEEPKAVEPRAAADGVYESTVQLGAGSQAGGSLLGLPGGTPGGRPATYPDRVTNKIYYMWHNPAKLPDPISCSVVFRIDSDGRASQIALERSSGIPAYDNSTLRAVYEAAPYPPFPRSMDEEYIVMRITFEYVP